MSLTSKCFLLCLMQDTLLQYVCMYSMQYGTARGTLAHRMSISNLQHGQLKHAVTPFTSTGSTPRYRLFYTTIPGFCSKARSFT